MLELTTVFVLPLAFKCILSYVLSGDPSVQRYRMPRFMVFRELTVYISVGGYAIFVCGTHS